MIKKEEEKRKVSMKLDAKIYIAGHRGLVGSAIVNNLKAKGYTNVIGKTHNELDLLDQEAVKAFFETEKPEYVFLAAAKVGGIVANNTYRADFIYENLQIQNNIIHQSYKAGVKKMILKSLKQEEENEMYGHDEVWSELLSTNTIAEWKEDSEDAIWK